MTTNIDLGQKIRKYRERAHMSQMDLELEIEASPGSISRIESGKVNPTKETIVKIIDILNLNSTEVVDLFSIPNFDISSLVKTSAKLSHSLDIDAVLQESVNEIAYHLGLVSAVICLIEDDKLNAQTFTLTPYTTAINQLIPVPFHMLSISMKEHNDNLFVKSIINNKPYYSLDLKESTKHAFPDTISIMISRVLGFKCSITFPLRYEKKFVGSILYIKNYLDDFRIEGPVLEAFSDHIAAAVVNAQKHQRLQQELDKLQNLKKNNE